MFFQTQIAITTIYFVNLSTEYSVLVQCRMVVNFKAVLDQTAKKFWPFVPTQIVKSETSIQILRYFQILKFLISSRVQKFEDEISCLFRIVVEAGLIEIHGLQNLRIDLLK